MSLTPEQYLSLSALAYEQLSNSSVGRPIKEVMQNIKNINKPEFNALFSLSSWTLVNTYTSPSGMSAIAVQNPKTKEIVFAYRGTDINRGPVEAIKDFLTDLYIASSGNLMLKDGANQFQDAFNFYIDTVKKVGGASNIGDRSFTGHSLGGGLAQYMAYMTNGAYKTMTFDAVGIGQILKDVNLSSYNNNVKNYVNENDFIGNYGDHLGEVIYIEDQAKVHKDAAIQKRNRDIDVAQQYAFDAVIEAAKNGEVGKGAAWLTMAMLAEIGQNMQNAADSFTITNPHNPSSLLNGDGKMGSKVSHGSATVVAAGKVTQAGLNVQTVFIKGVRFFVVELPTAVAGATIKVSMAVVDGSVKMFVKTSEFVGEIIYDTGTFIGYSLYYIGTSFGNGVSNLIAFLTRQAGAIPIRIDPIVLDISGQGITTKSVTAGVYYDLDNNGFAEKTGWIDAKSGILVLDRDGNGKIEAGKELFGDRTILDDGKTASSGFAALAALDSNHDGVIDAKDAKFSELRIWIDKDGNGVSTPDELLTLEEAGIKSLNLSNEFVGKVDENGNTIARVGSFTRTDGTTADMKEFFLQRDTADVQMTDSVEVPEDIMNLPEIHPMGNTYSLRQAMARDTTGALKQLVQDFMNANDTSLRQAKLQDILFAWVGASQINPTSRGSSFDARKLAVLETVTGTSYRNSPTSSPTAAEAPILERSYTTLLESIYTMLSMQTSLADVFRKFNYSLDLESENPIKLDVSSVQAYLDEQLQSNAVTGEKMLAEITRTLRNRGLISDAEFTHLREHFAKKSIKYQRIIDTAPLTTMIGTDAGDSINGVVDRDNVITAGDGNDTLIGAVRNDLLYGDAGNDYLRGLNGNDTLVGGQGNDRLEGGEGDDTYIFNKGDGVDVISDAKGVDTIQFGEGITPDDVVARVVTAKSSSDYVSLELSVKGTNDTITVEKQFGYKGSNYYTETPDCQIEKVAFADGTVWNLEEIHTRAHNMSGTDKNDTYYALDNKPLAYHGLAGNDSLVGGIANDLLYGDAGDDTIYGMRGDDVLIGGTGADQLYGREGNDIYIFSKGDGADYIEETDGFDKIQFGEGILPEDVVLRVIWGSGNNLSLSITIKDTTDKIVVNGHFGTRTYNSDRPHISKPGNQIEQITFSNGVSWDLNEIHRRAHDVVGTENNDSLSSFDDGAYVYHGLGGDDGIVGGVGNDSLYGNDGNDMIYGFGGNDVLSGGTGNDQLHGGAGDDVYLFSRGDGVDRIEETDGFDTIQFGENILPKDVVARVVSTEGNSISLELSIAGTNDKMTIHRHFGQYSYYQAGDIASPGNQIERVMFADGTAWNIDEIYRRAHDMVGTDGDDNFSMVGNAPVIYHGLDGNDVISGRSGKDILYGDAGDDSIFGGGTLIGGLGNDRIYGSNGDDVYIFNRGDGQDLITDTGGMDTIRFGDGIRPDDIVIKRVGNGYGHNLELCIKDTDDKVAVYEHFGTNSPWGSVDNPAVKIERVEFADGTVWTKEYIDDRMHNRTGTDGADMIEAYGKRGVVYHGLGGDDWLEGAAGDDKLYGDDGDDTISGGEGNNLLVGGRGNDIINGFSGDDTYIFNRGDGSDTIKDYGGTDTIQFGEGISPSDIVLKRVSTGNDYNLEISIKNADDKVTVVDYFGIYNVYGKTEATPRCMIEKIEFADGTIWTQQTIYDKMHNITGTDKDDAIRAYDNDPVEYHGLAGNDVLVGGGSDDKLYGGDGDDRLSGGEGNDLFVGGKGNDTIDSFRGDNIYIFNRGDGKDVITDCGGLDMLQFGEGIKPEDIILKRVYKNSNYNLEISIKDTDDAVTFVSHFGSSNYSGWYTTPDRMLDCIKFADGTVWTKDDIDYKMHHLTGTEENDRLVAYDKTDVVYYGRGGNDTLFGSEGNDKLYGDDGDDTISGGEGNDLLVGGRGNDELSGYRGDDTYIFNKGDGSDVISECGGTDTIKFGEGITPNDVDVRRVYKSGSDYGYALELSLKGTSDKIAVKNYFGYYSYSGFHKSSPESLIEKVVFADGTVWTQDTINSKVHNITGTEDGETIQAFDDDAVTYYGLGGNDNLYGSKSNDKLYGGAGNDRISGGEGDDLIVGGAGDDYLDGYYGNDTYIFNKGDGSDTVYDANGNDDKIILGYDFQDIMFERFGNNLRLRMIGSSDSVTINSWYTNNSNQYKIETFKSATGSTITHIQIENLIQAMSSFQKDTGMTWEQALTTQPSQVQAIVQEYWTVPGV